MGLTGHKKKNSLYGIFVVLVLLPLACEGEEIPLGGSGCTSTISCQGEHTFCAAGRCECETDFYDNDGVGNIGVCVASKYFANGSSKITT